MSIALCGILVLLLFGPFITVGRSQGESAGRRLEGNADGQLPTTTATTTATRNVSAIAHALHQHRNRSVKAIPIVRISHIWALLAKM
jgi:hypothetical protein